MRMISLQCALFVLATLGALPLAAADTVIDNANGYTLNSKGKLAHFSALAFDDKGRIIAVGSAAQVAPVQPHRSRHDRRKPTGC